MTTETDEMTETWHGTPGGYSNHACRCARCKDAWRVFHRDQRSRRRSELVELRREVETSRALIAFYSDMVLADPCRAGGGAEGPAAVPPCLTCGRS